MVVYTGGKAWSAGSDIGRAVWWLSRPDRKLKLCAYRDTSTQTNKFYLPRSLRAAVYVPMCRKYYQRATNYLFITSPFFVLARVGHGPPNTEHQTAQHIVVFIHTDTHVGMKTFVSYNTTYILCNMKLF